MFDIVDIDFHCNVVYTDEGHILEIESYVDEEDTPCLPEEAHSLFYITGTHSIERHVFTDEQRDFLEDAFD